MTSPLTSITPDQRRGPLEPHDQLPELQCEGWLNGAPDPFGQGPARLMVLDVWAQWCPEVPKSLPGLRELCAEFSPRGVVFVSFTTEKRSTADAFMQSHQVPWSSGYGASLEAIRGLGAGNFEMPVPGYEVKPLIYLATADGRVHWCDHHLRMDHADEDKSQLIAALREQIEAHLAASADVGTE
jgi:hypothetical protein